MPAMKDSDKPTSLSQFFDSNGIGAYKVSAFVSEVVNSPEEIILPKSLPEHEVKHSNSRIP